MISARQTGRPSVGTALRTGVQVVGARLVDRADADAQFECDGFERQQASTGLGEEVADEWGVDAMGEWNFFLARKRAERWIYRFETATGQG